MDANQGLQLGDVVAQIVQQATVLSVITAPIVFGVIEALKKMKLPSRFAGLFSAPIGVLVVFLVQGFEFTAFGILVGILSGLATSGTYSSIKASATPKE